MSQDASPRGSAAPGRQSRGREPSPALNLPTGLYGAILADVPWLFETWSQKGRGRSAERHYQLMSDEALAAMPIQALAAPDCSLFLWTSGPVLERSLKLMKAWGFAYKTIAFVWLKHDPLVLFREPTLAMGYWTRSSSEMVLLGTRGRPARLDRSVRQVVIEPRREHSRKPDEVARRIERLVGGSYLELFGRCSRKNWVVWGDQAGKFDEAKERSHGQIDR